MPCLRKSCHAVLPEKHVYRGHALTEVTLSQRICSDRGHAHAGTPILTQVKTLTTCLPLWTAAQRPGVGVLLGLRASPRPPCFSKASVLAASRWASSSHLRQACIGFGPECGAGGRFI